MQISPQVLYILLLIWLQKQEVESNFIELGTNETFKEEVITSFLVLQIKLVLKFIIDISTNFYFYFYYDCKQRGFLIGELNRVGAENKN